MKVNILPAPELKSLEPLTCRRSLGEVRVGSNTFAQAQKERLGKFAPVNSADLILTCAANFWPSEAMAAKLGSALSELLINAPDGSAAAWVSKDGTVPNVPAEFFDKGSLMLVYPWDYLAVNEDVVGSLSQDFVQGVIRNNVTIDGHIVLGKGSVILPGVYIEGNLIVGENTKIGPNCYIRGSTSIGDNCHIGQAVEVKNSIFMTKVSAGHLSYIGDSIVCPHVNFGAGTISANFRHDGKNHRSAVLGKIIDTGRRKFGTIIGDNVHTGIHCSIYPGRKIWPDVSTLPGDIVKKDLMK